MAIPRRAVTLAIVATAVCLAGAMMVLRWRDNRAFGEPRNLLARFPVEDATVLNVDLQLIRRAGLLSESKIAPEAEYKQFLDGTGFNYRRDLDSVTASFSRSGSYIIARGRFDWPRLRTYAEHNGGSCYEKLCRMQGSTPERHISFLPLRDDVMALAVSTDDLAANRLTKTGEPVTGTIPEGPAWISIPGTTLRQPGALPPGLRVVLSGLTNADRVVVTVGPAGSALEARLQATCRTESDAGILQSQLKSATTLLKEAAMRDPQTSKDELAAMLMGGTFNQSGRAVTGVWPIRKALIDSLTNGL